MALEQNCRNLCCNSSVEASQRLLTAFLPTIATSSSTTEFAESHGPCYTRASNTRGPHSHLHLLRHPTNELEQYSQLQNMKPLKSKEGYQAPGFFLDGRSNMESFVLWNRVPKWTLKIFIDVSGPESLQVLSPSLWSTCVLPGHPEYFPIRYT